MEKKRWEERAQTFTEKDPTRLPNLTPGCSCQHSPDRTRLLLLLLLLKLMESGKETFCFSNPGFCQANTRIMLKMAAVEEWLLLRRAVVWYGSSHHTALNL